MPPSSSAAWAVSARLRRRNSSVSSWNFSPCARRMCRQSACMVVMCAAPGPSLGIMGAMRAFISSVASLVKVVTSRPLPCQPGGAQGHNPRLAAARPGIDGGRPVLVLHRRALAGAELNCTCQKSSLLSQKSIQKYLPLCLNHVIMGRLWRHSSTSLSCFPASSREAAMARSSALMATLSQTRRQEAAGAALYRKLAQSATGTRGTGRPPGNAALPPANDLQGKENEDGFHSG